MSVQELNRRFNHHDMTVETKHKSDSLRDSVYNLADMIDIYCPDSREKSTALTKLEECLFWCNAALSRD